MHFFGSHVSAAGGLAKAVDRALAVGCDCIQVFTKNNNQWACKPLDDQSIRDWKSAFASSGMKHPIAHASYLINLASPDSSLRQKSIDALVVEIERCNQLDIEGLVVHPGAYTTSTETEGIAAVIDAVVESLSKVDRGTCRLLLENTAGQGTCLGHRLEHLEQMLSGVRKQLGKGSDRRIGICFDTCHALAAGYDMTNEAGIRATRQEIEDRFPKKTLGALHLNDSKKPLGCHVDRHEHIGRGCIGLDGFRAFLSDPFFARVPGYLETEKGNDPESGEDWDVINLRVLRELVGVATA